MFAERGLAATLDDIAHHAGVGVGTVYRRFPDKEHLIDALFEARIEEIVAVADAGLANPDALAAWCTSSNAAWSCRPATAASRSSCTAPASGPSGSRTPAA